MKRNILLWLAVLALVAAVGFAIVKVYESWRNNVRAEGVLQGTQSVQAKWDEDVRKRDKDKLDAITAARKDEQAKAAAAAKGESDARQKAELEADKSRAAAARSAAAAGGLSGNIAALDGAARAIGIPSAAACPREFEKQREAAVLAREMLGSCSARYAELGKAVDDAWDAVTLKLDTALGYINAVKP